MDDSIKLRDGKLHIFKQPGCQNFYYRFFVNGKYLTRTAKTSNLALAKSTAENFYDSYRFNHIAADGKHKHSWDEAEKGVLRSLGLEDTTSTSRIRTYSVKFAILRKCFDKKSIEEINKTNTLEEYVAWRRNVYRTYVRHDTLTNKTLRRDFDVLRAILKYALRQEWIERICTFPKLRSVPKAGGWFTLAEWKHLQKVAKQWIAEAQHEDEKQQRLYVWDYSLFLVHTGMRVDEAFHVSFADISLDAQLKTVCYIKIRGGKMAGRMKETECIGLVGAVSAIQRRAEAQPEHKPTDLLFPKNPREKLHKLLTLAGLDKDQRGERRTAKNFRHTFIMLRLLQGVDVYKLAKNCRTSVDMISQHYGSYINSRMSRDELIKFNIEPQNEPTAKGVGT